MSHVRQIQTISTLRAFRRDERGIMAVVLGLLLPVIFGSMVAATEYSLLTARRVQLQSAADAAALSAGRELVLANANDTAVTSVADRVAAAQLGSTAAGVIITSAVVNGRTGVQVNLKENMKFMFGKVFGWPSADIGVTAVAKRAGKGGKICALGLEPSLDATIRLDQSARITADKCAIYSDSKSPEGIKAFQNSIATAERICSAGGYVGKAGVNFTPTPVTDCPQIGDPLKDRTPPVVGGCDHTNRTVSGATETLNPGVYCGGLRVTQSGIAKLMPGEYIMDNGKLIVETGGTLEGDYVGFYFRGDGSVLDFGPDTTINLSAPKIGSMAGILFFEDRGASLLRKFRILSNNARRLLGTVYLPRGLLLIGANAPVGDQSAYTVVLARQIQLEAGPNLVLNSNYAGTDVPLPKGVDTAGTDVVLGQ